MLHPVEVCPEWLWQHSRKSYDDILVVLRIVGRYYIVEVPRLSADGVLAHKEFLFVNSDQYLDDTIFGYVAVTFVIITIVIIAVVVVVVVVFLVAASLFVVIKVVFGVVTFVDFVVVHVVINDDVDIVAAIVVNV